MMKKMNYEEFQHRVNEVNKAARIFDPLTKNVSDAFKIYQEVLAEEKMEVFISTMVYGSKSLTPLDDYVRPTCPECNTELGLKLMAKDQNGKEWETAWVCTNCNAEFYSDKTVKEWMDELEKKYV